MRKNNKNKIFIIIALCIAISGLTIGFAAFSKVLTISSSADVDPNPENFSVEFSSSEGNVVVDDIVPTTTGDVEASNAIINNEDTPTISNLNISFTEPGQSVNYQFYVINTGDYDAYLNKIFTSNAVNSTSYKVCKPLPGTTQESVDEVCDAISVTITANSGLSYTLSNQEMVNSSKFLRGSSTLFNLTVNYDSSAKEADGDFIVEFGEVVFEFSSVAG